MIRLKEILNHSNIEEIDNSPIGDYVYHVTPKKNIPLLKVKGIVPHKEWEDSTGDTAVFLFKDITTAEDAVMNWLGDKFPEEVELVMLTIKTEGLDIKKSKAGFEVMSLSTIPWKNIVRIENI